MKNPLATIRKVFGNELSKYRKAVKDMTQEEFAHSTGLGSRHISAMEAGDKLPRIDTLLRLRNGGVDINYIFDRILEALKDRNIDLTKK
jgi:transcriptional regulator with XRE-family HTH domain